MIDINTVTPKRIFCFGCSFTRWNMSTWADILELHFENTDTEVHNFGRGGAGNYYIFNAIVEASLEYEFTKDDLVLIQWSGVIREDRFKDGRWVTPGTVTNQSVYSKTVVKDWFLDVVGMLKRDYSYIHAIQRMLKANNIDYEMFSMNGVTQYDATHGPVDRTCTNIDSLIKLYENTLAILHPSMQQILWGNEGDWPPGRIIKGTEDIHPLPTEHLLYLEKVFQFNPSGELRIHIDTITKELLL